VATFALSPSVVPLLDVVRLFLLPGDRQIPSRAPDMAIRREQSGRGGTLQFNNTLQGDYLREGESVCFSIRCSSLSAGSTITPGRGSPTRPSNGGTWRRCASGRDGRAA
jgi:hypothetical protein